MFSKKNILAGICASLIDAQPDGRLAGQSCQFVLCITVRERFKLDAHNLHPCKTISIGVSKLAAGDTFIVMAGDYSSNERISRNRFLWFTHDLPGARTSGDEGIFCLRQLCHY